MASSLISLALIVRANSNLNLEAFHPAGLIPALAQTSARLLSLLPPS